jgi:hypothetical protein
MLHLVAGFGLGAMLLAAKERPFGAPFAAALLGAHRDVVLLGWMAQCVLGVGYWILPRRSSGTPRGPEWPVAAGWLLLNAGVLLAALGRPAGRAWVGYAAVAAGTVLVAGALLPRVRATWG